MSMTYEKIFTAASSDVTDWWKVPIIPGDNSAPTGDHRLGTQAFRVQATSSGTGAAGVLGVALVDPNNTGLELVWYIEATLTVTARRTNLANSAANNYIVTVAFADGPNTSNILDALGAGNLMADSTGNAYSNRKLEWRIGLKDAGGLSNVTVRVTPTRAI